MAEGHTTRTMTKTTLTGEADAVLGMAVVLGTGIPPRSTGYKAPCSPTVPEHKW